MYKELINVLELGHMYHLARIFGEYYHKIYYTICLQDYYCKIYVLIFFNYGILKNLKLGDNIEKKTYSILKYIYIYLCYFNTL